MLIIILISDGVGENAQFKIYARWVTLDEYFNFRKYTCSGLGFHNVLDKLPKSTYISGDFNIDLHDKDSKVVQR